MPGWLLCLIHVYVMKEMNGVPGQQKDFCAHISIG